MEQERKWIYFSVAICVSLIVLTILIGIPLLTIWSLNTLLQLGIPYSFKTCMATSWFLFIMLMFHGIQIFIKKYNINNEERAE